MDDMIGIIEGRFDENMEIAYMRVLITGSNGFLGSVLTPMLLQVGHEVVALDNFMYRQTSLADCCADPKFTLYP